MCCNTWTSLISAVANPANVCLQWVMLGTFKIRERDGSENVKKKKAIGLQGKTDNFARASHFFVHFFVNTARLRRENA